MLRRESHTSTIAQAGAKVLEGLLNEEGQRRTQFGLPPAAEDFSRNTTPDTDHSTLRDVVGRIASVSHHGKSSFSPTSATAPPTVGALSDSQNNPFSSRAPVQAPEQAQPMPFTFSASAGQPSSNTAPSGAMDNSLPPSQSFLGSSLGDSLLGGDESEDLLRSLGFFEVTGNSMNSGQGAGSSEFSNSFFGSNNAMAQDLGWLDGLGDW